MNRLSTSVFLVAAIATLTAHAADWPQWRGPDANGIASQSPVLLDRFPKDGPKKLWESEIIHCGNPGGWSSVVVAGGKAYVHEYLALAHPWRIITKDTLVRQGYFPDMPAALSKKVEEARVSDARKHFGGQADLFAWNDRWIRENLTPELSKYEGAIRYRFKPHDTLSLEVLEKLVPIVDKKFDKQDDWLKWVAESGLDPDEQQAVRSLAAEKDVSEYLYCLDAANGKTLWKKSLTCEDCYYQASSTPTVYDGRVYLLGSTCAIFCFDAVSGSLLWQSEPFSQEGNDHSRGSSVVIGDGLAVAMSAKSANAVSLKDGKTAWTAPGTDLEASGSAGVWSGGGKSYFLVEFATKLAMVDPKNGQRVSPVRGGGSSTPTIVGNYAVACNNRLLAYKLSPGAIESLWTIPFRDLYSSPVIERQYVYAVGGGDHYAGSSGREGKAMCVELETGKVRWEEPLALAEMSSPVLADGKIIAEVGTELVVFKASPEKFELVGRVNLGLQKWCTPALVDGNVLLRTPTKVVCYDLAKH